MANGFQVAAITGPKNLMELFATGGVLHGGTYNSQILSMAATIATLESISVPGFHSELNNKSTKLQEGIEKALTDAGVQASIAGFPGFFHVGLGLTKMPREYRDLIAMDKERYREFCHAMLKRGVRTLERGAWFVSSTHTDDILDETIAAASSAFDELIKIIAELNPGISDADLSRQCIRHWAQVHGLVGLVGDTKIDESVGTNAGDALSIVTNDLRSFLTLALDF